MLKNHADLLLAVLILLGVLLLFDEGLHRLGVELDLPLIGGR